MKDFSKRLGDSLKLSSPTLPRQMLTQPAELQPVLQMLRWQSKISSTLSEVIQLSVVVVSSSNLKPNSTPLFQISFQHPSPFPRSTVPALRKSIIYLAT